MTEEPVLLREETSWGLRLTLNRPAKLNAISAELRDALAAAGDGRGRVAAAVELGLDLQSFVNMSEAAREFDAIVRSDGLKAALAWRDRRDEERLADRHAD